MRLALSLPGTGSAPLVARRDTSPLAGEVARQSRAGEGCRHGLADTPHPVPLPQGERGRIRQSAAYVAVLKEVL